MRFQQESCKIKSEQPTSHHRGSLAESRDAGVMKGGAKRGGCGAGAQGTVIADPPSASEQPHHWQGVGSDACARGEFGASREWGAAIWKSRLLGRPNLRTLPPRSRLHHFESHPTMQTPRKMFLRPRWARLLFRPLRRGPLAQLAEQVTLNH